MPRPRHRFAALSLVAGLVTGAGGPVGALDLLDPDAPPPPKPPIVTVDDWAVEPSPIPRTGWGDDRLEPVLDALDDFMGHRCVGAATIGIAFRGVPIGEWGLGRTSGRASPSILDPECGDDTTDPYDPSASNVDDRTPMMLGSVSKPVTAATLRWVLKQTYHQHTGEQLTDEELEALRIFGDDFPVPLVPSELGDLYTGAVPLPPELDVSACEGPDGQPVVDPRWKEMTVGQLLAHRAGLPRSAPSYESEILPRLAYLRGLTTEAHFLAVHQAERAAAPSVEAFDAATSQLQGDGDPVYFLGQPTLVETLMVVAGRCLTHEPGVHKYSNTSPAYWQVIINHLDPSGRLTSEVGDPASHTGSALQRFVADELGLNSFGNVGIFRTLGEAGLDGIDRRVPQQRNWNESQQTYVPVTKDSKRPHCVFVDGSCSTSPWRTGERADWSYGVGKLPFHLTYGLRSPGTGSLAAQPRYMLTLMAEHWIGGYGVNPRIGAPRNGNWTTWASHNGSLAGGRAHAWQFDGSTRTWAIPQVDGSGRIRDDVTTLHPGSAKLPAGLDVFVAINQKTDPKCQASEALAASQAQQRAGRGSLAPTPMPTYTCGEAYRLLPDYLFHGLAQVDWNGLIADLDAPGAVVAVRPGSGSLAPAPAPSVAPRRDERSLTFPSSMVHLAM